MIQEYLEHHRDKPNFSVKANNTQEYFHAKILSNCGGSVLSNSQMEEDDLYSEEDLYSIEDP